MRMWMVDPKIMCRQHLLGEHLEIHMFVSCINKGKNVEGYLYNNLLEPLALHSRHDALVDEMTYRGYKHKSPLPMLKPDFTKFNRQWLRFYIQKVPALNVLIERCDRCRIKFETDIMDSTGEMHYESYR